jgi:manganese/iron transport system substrate-binding protein
MLHDGLRPRFERRSGRMLALTGIISLGISLTSGCSTSNSPGANRTSRPDNIASPNAATAKSIKVVATSSVLCDLTRRIAQESVDLKCLVAAGQDPHTYEATPADRQALETANLVFYNGYDFEPSILKLIQASPDQVTKVAVAELAVTQPRVGGHEHHDHEDHHDHERDTATKKSAESTTDKAAADPHVWHDARHGIAMVDIIQKQLAQANPSGATSYSTNAQTMRDRLTKVDAWIKTSIATIPATQRKLVTTHDALGYYSEAYGIAIEGALQGLSTETQPTPTRLKTLVDEIKSAQVPAIFAESSGNRNIIQTLAQDAKVKLAEPALIADGLGAAGSNAESYETMLIQNTNTIVTNLGGKVAPLP